MDVKLYQPLAHAIGAKFLKDYRVSEDAFKWNRDVTIDLSHYSKFKIIQLKNAIAEYPELKGAQVALKDIAIWLDAVKNAKSGRPRNVKQFASLLTEYMKNVTGHRIYLRDTERDVDYAYYLGEIKYVPERVERGYTYPAYTNLSLYYREFGKDDSDDVKFFHQDIIGRTVLEALAEKGLQPETAPLRETYDETIVKYDECALKVGRQYWARGNATDDLDGNPERRDSWYWSRVNTIRMDKNGDPSRIVIDVFKEEDKERQERNREHLNLRWWYIAENRKPDAEGDMEEDDDLVEAAIEDGEWSPPEIPIHPTVATFDMRRHVRLRLHVDQLERYVYTPSLGDKLVLPEDDRALVDILLENKSEFADIIAGKGGGAVVMCTGRPGLGKTLTAEIYAEVSARPLYTVQCSQLGTDPDALEDNLLKAFARAERWNAILLLDEADVYVAPRANDLTQNAIVGVFLRVLEYYKGVLFMTSNRPDLVDDAIASRCIARLTYAVPSVADQERIWAIQATQNDITLGPKEIHKIAVEHPELSGRDVKNLLKLAILVSRAQKKPINAALINYVKRFKPTMDLAREESANA